MLSILLAFGIAVSSHVPATSLAAVVVDRVIAVVNGEVITLSDLQREAAKEKSDIGERLLLEDMINKKLQMAAAKRSGMDVTEKELNDAVADIMKRNSMNSRQFEGAIAKEGLTLDQYKDELKEQITLSRTFNKYVRSGLAVDESEIRAYYERNIRNFTLPEEIRVRHIFIKLPARASPAEIASIREKARAMYERAAKGEDFIRLVRAYSEGGTVAQDGDLGFMQRKHALPEIEQAARFLSPGEVAGPLECETGFHIIRLEDIRTPVTPLDKVRDEIVNILYQQKVDNTYRSWLQTLRSESHIEIRL